MRFSVHVALAESQDWLDHHCERSVGTVFQLPSPDAIYSRDEEKKTGVCGHSAVLGLTHGPCALGARGDRKKEATRPAA
jgi:hypothetical protein